MAGYSWSLHDLVEIDVRRADGAVVAVSGVLLPCVHGCGKVSALIAQAGRRLMHCRAPAFISRIISQL